ncbi:hypothetical protein [Brevibacillus dissolubilis]|uniref:hypothetical protein n=1 Tax=Brevibacillus dissolubilis TaxID=1844116 RepID=UPI0011175B2F|nr:hypothetical protein [Brevibacillus dissolubilis]
MEEKARYGSGCEPAGAVVEGMERGVVLVAAGSGIRFNSDSDVDSDAASKSAAGQAEAVVPSDTDFERIVRVAPVIPGRHPDRNSDRDSVNREDNRKRSVGKWVLLVAVTMLSFACGSVVTSLWYGSEGSGYGVGIDSVFANGSAEMAWVRLHGLTWGEEQLHEPITQAEFLRIVLMTLKIPETPGATPKGAENHKAASIYATAKAHQLIDCSCQIKPDEPITAEEAARFIMLGVNGREKRQVLGLRDAVAWVSWSDDLDVSDASDGKEVGRAPTQTQGQTPGLGKQKSLLTEEAIHMMQRLEEVLDNEKESKGMK